jgi:hypothetical protein
MISDLFASLVAFFVVEPLQAEIAERIEHARPTLVIVKEARACIASQGPKLMERASSDWGWAATTAVSVTIGLIAAEDLLDQRDPACANVVKLLTSSPANDA